MEAGWSVTQDGDPARSQSVPMAFRLAWSESWGVVVGIDAHDWQRAFDGATAHSGGDTSLELKYRLPVAEGLSFGAELGPVLPTARPPIGTGKADWGAIGIASIDSDFAHVDINAGGTRLVRTTKDRGAGRECGRLRRRGPFRDSPSLVNYPRLRNTACAGKRRRSSGSTTTSRRSSWSMPPSQKACRAPHPTGS